MSLLMLSRPRVVASAASSTVLAAVYRTWGTPVDSTARGTLPLAPNHGYTTDDVALFRSGVEVPIYVEELRGRHNNGIGGDGGARAFYYECDTTDWTDGDVMEWRLGVTRTTTDLSASGRGNMAMVRAHFDNPRVVLCTDASYLCTTRATFHPLVPESSILPADVPWAVTARKASQDPMNPASGGTSNHYDLAWTAFSWWQQSGDPDDWWWANRAMAYNMTYSSPVNTGTHSATVHLNPEGIAGSLINGANETRALMNRDLAASYVCIGYGQLWRNLNSIAIQKIGSTVWNRALTDDNFIGNAGARFSFGRNLTPVIYAAMVDCTYIMPTGEFSGGNPRRTPTWVTDVPRILDAIDDAKYDGSLNAHWTNFRGVRPTTDPSNEAGNLPGGIGDQQTFQAAIPALALIDYYTEIHADSRIPGWVRANLDVLLKNGQYDDVLDRWSWDYMLGRYTSQRRGAIAAPFSLGGDWVLTADGHSGTFTSLTSTSCVLSGTVNEVDGYFVGDTVVITSGGVISTAQYRVITGYSNSTRTISWTDPLSPFPVSSPSGIVVSENAARAIPYSSFDGAADWMRVLYFVQAFYPDESVNGLTYTQWLNAFRARAATLSTTNRSVMGRYFNTQGVAFAVLGPPTGPSAIREPVLWESA